MRIQFLVGVLLAALFFHCKKEEAPPLPTFTEFIGKWEQERPDDGTAYDNQHLTIEFMADSTFQMIREVWKAAVCSNRIDYIAGKVSLDGDQLRMKGKFYYTDFQGILPNHCTGETMYQRTSQVQFANGELLIFPSTGHPKARMVKQ
jgi:hypothetical protein